MNSLTIGDVLTTSGELVSNNGKYTMKISKGDLVLYNSSNTSLWNAKTTTAATVSMQPSGNLEIFDSANNSVWNSGTSADPGALFIVQNDGNAVIYKKCPAWATNTYQG